MRIVLWLSVAFAIGCYICEPVTDPDLWWHITIGRWIISNHQVPHIEYWNQFALGKDFIAYSWTNEILFALVDAWFGDKGLVCLKVLLGILLSYTAFYVFGRLAKDWFFGGLLAIISVVACYNNFTLRPQTIVWIIALWLVWSVDKIEKQGWSYKRGLIVLALGSFWANTHLSQIIGLGIITLWMLGSVTPRVFILVTVSFLIGTLVTPYFGTEWLTLLKKTGHPFMYSEIAEFQPANIRQYATVMLILLLGFSGVLVQSQPRKLQFGKWILAAGIIVAGLAVVKFLPFSVLITSSLLAYFWGRVESPYKSLGNMAEGLGLLNAKWDWIPKEGLSFVCISIGIVNFFDVYNYPINFEIVPVKIMDVFEDLKLPKPVLHEFGKGGYVMYRFSDVNGNISDPVCIDGRTNINPPEVWEEFMKSVKGLEGWNKFLDRVNANTIIWGTDSPLSSILKERGGWCEVYRDAGGKILGSISLFVKKEYVESREDLMKIKVACY